MIVMAKNSGHRRKGKVLRLTDPMWEQLALLVERNGSDETEELRIAVREHLRANNLWPPPHPPGKPSKD